MSKRFRGDRLTGGTGDVNPEFLNIQVTESAANTFTQDEVTLPIHRIGGGSMSKSQVVEILKIGYEMPAMELVDADSLRLQLTYSSQTAILGLGSACVIDKFITTCFTASAVGTNVVEQVIWHDLTDGVGHGILVGTPSIFIGVQGVGMGAARSYNVKVMYRLKNVGVMEYVGMVQSQVSA